jgi:hypothetical protein
MIFFIWRAPDLTTVSEIDCEKLLSKDNYVRIHEVSYEPNSFFIDLEGSRYYLSSSIPCGSCQVYLDLHYRYGNDLNRILSGGLDVSWVRQNINASSKIANSVIYGYIFAHIEERYICEMACELSMDFLFSNRPVVVSDNAWMQNMVPRTPFG